MQKTFERLQAALEQDLAYTKKLISQIDCMQDQLRNTIPLQKTKKFFLLFTKNVNPYWTAVILTGFEVKVSFHFVSKVWDIKKAVGSQNPTAFLKLKTSLLEWDIGVSLLFLSLSF